MPKFSSSLMFYYSSSSNIILINLPRLASQSGLHQYQRLFLNQYHL
jgi:hypothetical protein